MKSSASKRDAIFAIDVAFTAETLTVELSNGRSLSVPLSWFPRLVQGTQAEREDWQLQGQGGGIHWPQLDEDISVESLIAGHPSHETEASLKRWMEGRRVRNQT